MSVEALYKCGKCKAMLPREGFYSHKGNYRGFGYLCKECNKMQAKITRERHKDRINKKSKQWRADNKEHCAIVSKARVDNNRTQWMELVVSKRMDKCSICGYSKCFAAIDFHHVTPQDKKYGIAGLLIRKFTQGRAKELEKCVAVCANCHRELHASNQTSQQSRRRESTKDAV
jgi:hypothetical protein